MNTAQALTAAGRQVPSAWLSSRPRITGEQLPFRLDLSPSRAGAVIVCALGAFWLYFSAGLLSEIFADGHPIIVLFAVFPLTGVGLFAWGISQLFERRSVLYGETGVEVAERTWKGARQWSVPYSDYLGILQREHIVRRKNSSTTYQIVQLLHADATYDLPLYVVRGDSAPRDRWEALSARFGLPALQLDDDRVTARPSAALNASLAEQVRAGQLQGDATTSRPPPDGIVMRREGEGRSEVFWLDLRRTRLPAWAYALFIAMPLVFVAAALGHADGDWPPAAFGLAFLAGAVWLRWKDGASPRSIRVSRDGVENHDAWPWRKGDPTALSHQDIEAVRIHRSGKSNGPVLAVESDRGTMHLGQGLTRAELAWLRDFLTASVATA